MFVPCKRAKTVCTHVLSIFSPQEFLKFLKTQFRFNAAVPAFCHKREAKPNFSDSHPLKPSSRKVLHNRTQKSQPDRPNITFISP